MKNIQHLIFVLCLLSGTAAQAQEVNPIVEQYKTAISTIETIHCQVEQLDTFLSGTVWQHQGQVTLLRAPGDQLFGFYYKASKDVGGEALYDGLSDFQIDHKKQTYELTPNPRAYILGSPGGQLVIPELMNYQDPEVTPRTNGTGPVFRIALCLSGPGRV